jgi:hypothetical protein
MTIESENATLTDLAERYALTRVYVESLRDALKIEQDKLDADEARLFDAMEKLGIRAFRHELYGQFLLSDLADATLPDPYVFVAWARDNAPELLIANRMRLGKLIRDHMKGDYDFPEPGTPTGLPPGVDFKTRRSINWRRPKGGE